MKHERMRVLDLLDQGKITAEEAAKLLESLKRPEPECHSFVFDEDMAHHVEDKFNRFTKGVDSFTREFGGRVESIYKDVEPKIKKASQAVLEKTAAIFDEISKSLNDTLENARTAATEDEECCCCCDEPAPDDEPKEN